MNNIETNFVPYQIALDMKSIGFDEPCIRGWYEDGGIWYHPDSDIVLDNPTFSSAFRWFREKHGLIGYVHPLSLLEDTGEWCYEITNFKSNWDEDTQLHSIEEAELACLTKLIQIVKEIMENLNTIPTAEEILIKEEILLKTIEESGNFPLNLTRDTHIGTAKSIKKAMIEFAKLHVEACKKEYLHHGFGIHRNHEFDKYPTRVPIDEDSILNVYPVTLIK